ncbi:2-amino-4-hydroxy-6-hydroxymethyldihydropteridine diphosphokinase [Paenalcaligenes hominis]|uniref:2-amino-4-hydroxy-6- hydroxymethyldihydropteridine diphosphokinase n=1 Tax=Paenalcaligenes hominis TaxID=643674 RepID=UPI003526397F
MTNLNPSPTVAYIGMGANLGDAIGTLLKACEALHQLEHTTDVRISGFYQTAPVDADGPDYINAVAAITTRLTAPALLQALLAIENEHGRERNYPNAPRTLDLDLLLYGNEQFALPELTVPHPRLHLRAFVLHPLAELAPTLQLAQGPIQDLLQRVADQPIRSLDQD